MELFELKADIRTARGNSPARELRRNGKIPAVVYGPSTEPASVTVGIKDLETAIKNRTGSQVFVNLSIEDEGVTTRSVMLKDLQKHPVTGNFLHADFYDVDMSRKIKVWIPVVTTGKCLGVEMGGMLQIIRRELEALCYPGDIPEAVTLDVTNLDVGDSIHIKEVAVKGVEFIAEVNFTVLTVLGKKAEVEGGEEAEETEE